MNKRFKTGDVIQIGSRESNTALVLGPAWSAPATGGMWWVLFTNKKVENKIKLFQNASLIKVISNG